MVSISLLVPGALAAYAGGRRELEVEVDVEADVEAETEAEIEPDAATAAVGDGRAGAPIRAVSATTVTGLLDRLADQAPALERRLRDELGRLRRHVNVYVDGVDVRTLAAERTPVPDGASVQVIAAISGG